MQHNYLRPGQLRHYIEPLVQITSRIVCLGTVEDSFDKAENADIESDGFHLLHARFTCTAVASDSDSSDDGFHQTITGAQQALARSVIGSIIEVAKVASLFEEGFNLTKALRFHVITTQASLACWSDTGSDCIFARWEYIRAALNSMQSSRYARILGVVEEIIRELKITNDPSYSAHIAIAALDQDRPFEAAFLEAVTIPPQEAEV